MAELIEKVARLAGWYCHPDSVDWFDSHDLSVWCAWGDGGGVLTADGLRILLDELLRAGWALMWDKGDGYICWSVYEGPITSPCKDADTLADTLEEAVMLAYIAMKEGNNG